MKKKILIIPDIPHNAADLASELIIRFAAPHFDFEKLYEGKEGRRGDRNAGRKWNVDYQPYDGVFFMLGNRVDHGFPKEKTLITALESNELCMPAGAKIYGAVSKRIQALRKDLILLEWGVDGRLFYYNPLISPIVERKDLIIGFAGMPSNLRKNFEENFRPLYKLPNVEVRLAESRIGTGVWHGRPYIGMPNFYNSLDVYVQPSKGDGLPITVVEATACGVPTIGSKYIGASELLSIVIEPTSENFIEAVNHLNKNRHLLSKFREEALRKSKGWDWTVKIIPYLEAFNKICGG